MALRRHRLLVVSVILALVGAVAATGCTTSSKSAANAPAHVTTTTAAPGATVAMSEYAFAPTSMTIEAGQTVEWKNDGNVAHTVTETTAPHSFASADVDPGHSFTYRFAKPGTYSYVCSIHPDRMHGTIVVTSAA